jgi:hypothetical protein
MEFDSVGQELFARAHNGSILALAPRHLPPSRALSTTTLFETGLDLWPRTLIARMGFNVGESRVEKRALLK